MELDKLTNPDGWELKDYIAPVVFGAVGTGLVLLSLDGLCDCVTDIDSLDIAYWLTKFPETYK
jgi:hypothetical protein